MKTTRLVLVCTLAVAAIVIIGSCASSRKTIAGKDFVTAWSGTWANRGLVGNPFHPQILINHPDETMEFFQKPSNMESGIKDMRIRIFGIPSITDKWIDREGKIWYRAATKPTTDRGTVLSYYGFIHESGDVLEILEVESTKMIDEWDPVLYHHRVYYRQ